MGVDLGNVRSIIETLPQKNVEVKAKGMFGGGVPDFDEGGNLGVFINKNPALVKAIETHLTKSGKLDDANSKSEMYEAVRLVLIEMQHMQDEGKLKATITAQKFAATASESAPAASPAAAAPPEDKKNLLHSIGTGMILTATSNASKPNSP